MILGDKLIRLRKRNGWSQEELAERMEVSRQAVSKWESAQTTPDLEKVLMLSDLFGVTTDYLLRDELEDEEPVQESGVRRLTLARAEEYLALRHAAAVQIAAATFLCVIAAIPLMILGAASELPSGGVSESAAAGAGMTALLVLVAIAVTIFISCGQRSAPFAFLEREPFETEYGVERMVKERQRAFRPAYTRCHIAGACLCVLSPAPLFLGVFTENEFLTVCMLCVTMVLAGIGAACFIVAGVCWASMQRLLQEGEFDPRERPKNRVREAVSTAYWLTAAAVYLGWSFWTEAWETTWIVWPVAGVLFVAVMCVCGLLAGREK